MTKLYDVRNSDAYRRLRDTEQIARHIFVNQPNLVPGLLQVPAYSLEVICRMQGLAADDPEAAALEAIRDKRRTTFAERLRGAEAPHVTAVIDESVLQRAVAGSAAAHQQVRHLHEMSMLETVHLGIIPMSHGPHPGLVGGFEVHVAPDGTIVFFEDAEGDRILDDDRPRIQLYRETVESLMTVAASGDDARALLKRLGG
jgi:hypothetical protein